jgi:hypothetical protein
MATDTEFKNMFGITSSQLTKLGQMLDARSPQVDGSGDPRANNVNDIVAHMKARYKADVRAFLQAGVTAPDWD